MSSRWSFAFSNAKLGGEPSLLGLRIISINRGIKKRQAHARRIAFFEARVVARASCCLHLDALANRTLRRRVDWRIQFEVRALYPDEFANEQYVPQEFRLMVPRSIHDRDGKEFVGLLFRHDKVSDFFMQKTFAEDQQLQLDYIDDPKFRGVYLLFAQTADLEIARRLRNLIVTRAAENRDHTLNDEFVRRLGARDPLIPRSKVSFGSGGLAKLSRSCCSDLIGRVAPSSLRIYWYRIGSGLK
jgi:hypothetical protein